MRHTQTRAPRPLFARAAATALTGTLGGLALAGCASSNAPAASTAALTQPAAVASTAVTSPPASTPPAIATPTDIPATPSAAASPSDPAPSATATSSPTAPVVVPAAAGIAPHFATPEAAMRYLVDAYNARDLTAEMHVTTPDSRTALEGERQWVQTFSFHSCTANAGAGDYSCRFDMTSMVPGLAIPSASASTDTSASDAFANAGATMNEITVLVAPATRPGWYMYYNMGCGDG